MGAVEERADGVIVHVRLQPKASREDILDEVDGRLRMRVSAPPVEGAANEAAIRLLAKRLGVAKSNVTLLRGDHSREKDFLVEGLSVEKAKENLKYKM